MENFRPPAMDEVKKQQKKNRLIIGMSAIVIIVFLTLGGTIGFRKLTVHLNYLSVEKKYQVLSNYYKALVTKDTEALQKIAPDFQLEGNYPFIQKQGSYALYIYPEMQTNEQYLLYTLIDHSVTPSVSYFKEVTYGTNKTPIIQYITNFGDGRQID